MFDIIVIAFKDEIDFLPIQAESISRYVPTEHIGQIRIVINDTDDICELVDTAWWGNNQHKVIVTPYSKWNYDCRIDGWDNQQICKLLAAAESQCEWSMSLDAKTWFIQQLDYDRFFTNGKQNAGQLSISEFFESSTQFVEQHYGIEMHRILGPGGVPFMFHTGTVKHMIEEFDDFVEFFQTHVKYPTFLTEYYLYAGFVIKHYGGYSALYNKAAYYSVLNIADWEAKDFDRIAKRLHDSNLLTASIHRRAYKSMTVSQIQHWVDFLLSRHIVRDRPKLLEQLNTRAIQGDDNGFQI